MNYSIDPRDVRIDIWKTTMKWMETRSLRFTRFYAHAEGCPQRDNPDLTCACTPEPIKATFINAIREQHPDLMDMQVIVTCLVPYHQHSHPLMVVV